MHLVGFTIEILAHDVQRQVVPNTVMKFRVSYRSDSSSAGRV